MVTDATTTRVYSVNFDSLGAVAFDLNACLSSPPYQGSCNLVTGAVGPNGRQQGIATANGLVFVAAVGPSGMEVQMWDASLSILYDTYTASDVVSPYIAEANGYVYCVEGATGNGGRPFALGYDSSPTPQFNGVISYGAPGSSPLGPNGVAAVGEGVLVVSSPTLVRVYKLASPISGRIGRRPVLGRCPVLG